MKKSFILIFIISLNLYAQTDTLFLSLDSALNLALTKSPDKTEALIDKKSGLINLVNGLTGILPSPSAQANYAVTKNSVLSNTPNSQTTTYSGTIGLNQVIFDPNAYTGVYKGILSNDYYRLSAKNKLANIVYTVKTSYYNLAKTYHLYEIAQTALNRAQDNFNFAKEKYRLGQITKFELLRSETYQSQAELDLLNAEKNLKIATEELKSQIGYNDNFPIKPITIPEIKNIELDDNLVLLNIFANNPTLNQNKKTKTIARTSYLQAIANLLPTINFFWQSNYTDTILPKSISNWQQQDNISYGIRLNFPIFEIKSYLLNISNTRNELNRAKLLERKAEILIHKTAIDAIYAYKDAKMRYQYALKNLELNQNLLTLAQEQYRLGAISQLDLFNVELNFRNAQNTFISALYDTYTSYAQIEYLMGITNLREKFE
ncbi:MAG: TolC family protein [candidate division WOR-3 bacterium]